MRNLSSYANVYANYLKTGVQPRTVVRIPVLGTDLTASTLKSTGTISRTAKPFGGYEQAATLSISNLILEDDVNFCTEATIDHKDEGVLRGAGSAISAGSPMEAYATIRNKTTGAITDPTLTVGQQYNSGLASYSVFRPFMQFQIPAALTTCEEAAFYLRGINKYSLVDFYVYVVAGTWSELGTSPVYDTGLYNDFTGWAASGAYSLTQLNEDFSTEEFFRYDASYDENEQCVMLRLNAAGRQAVVDAAGSVFRVMLISKNDADNTTPTRDEFVIFDAASVELRLRYNPIGLDNTPVYVYRYYGNTQPDYTDMLELFRGVITKYSIGLRTMDIEIRKDEGPLKRQIPDGIITEADYVSVTDPGVDNEGVFGKPIPVIYGDFTIARSFIEAIGSFTEELGSVRCESSDFFKAYMIYSTGYHSNIVYKYFHYCSFAIHTLTKFIALWNGELESFVNLPCDFNPFVAGTGKLVAGVGGAWFPYKIATSDYPTPTLNPVAAKIFKETNSSGMTDQLYSQDSDPTNWSTINSSTDSWDGATDIWGISGFDTVAFVIETYAPNGYGSNHITFNQEIYISNKDNKIYDENDNINTDGQHVFYFDNDSDLTSEDIYFEVHITASSPFSASYPIWFRNIQVMRGYVGTVGNEVYLTGKGRPDDTSGTVTGTASALIENPSHVIESLARSEFDIATASIDTADFDTAATSLANWKLAFQLLETTDGIKLLDQIGEQCKGSLFRDEYDRLSIKIWDKTQGFAHSGDDIPDDLDIFQTNGATTIVSGVEYVTRNPIMIESLTLDQTDIDECYNSFEIRFRKNYATGDYREVITIDNGEGTVGSVTTTLVSGDESYMENDQTITGLKTLCANSYNDYGEITRKLTIDADYIRDRATAVKLLQHNIECYAVRRYTVELTTYENALWIEYGDRVNIREKRVNERFGIPTAYRKKWAFYGIKHTLRGGEMRLKFMEVETDK